MKDTYKIRLIHESPLLNVPEMKKTELKKMIVDSMNLMKKREYQVEVLSKEDKVVMKFKYVG
jgi:hypothetical protein